MPSKANVKTLYGRQLARAAWHVARGRGAFGYPLAGGRRHVLSRAMRKRSTARSTSGSPTSREAESWAAAMVPHAGWVYSGRLAADVFSRVKFPKRVIVLAPRHGREGAEWAVAPHRTWQLPGGCLDSDPELAAALAEAIPGLELDAAAHASRTCHRGPIAAAGPAGAAQPRCRHHDSRRRTGGLAAIWRSRWPTCLPACASGRCWSFPAT